ncbi:MULTISPECIES: hypothetical protein [unclassified Acinetobacter]|uniref:hypothetical protein n=1 Tax=unclassified Acinetobacter TaxID=196816 RepID=UPI00244BAB9A|nr:MULTISPECIES: hypothetical protein [unclassified Acinetobacter]MDH0030998.1 hypothetical protein [Acinetobacter sp. GD04021]MDH0886570.1 hypothetical protein [Acinetobacter sp. GD03873]MDH1082992.1 hypothetical protein [Acinetobacter sp. GD03983]MDH2190047.1 hypothetical protein [Acinetobacter sp. GD03645]MDH2203171.1 hypothetical protein [Acinetobacter sp. GD03647]
MHIKYTIFSFACWMHLQSICFAQTIYTYKDEKGSTILSNRERESNNFELKNTIVYPDNFISILIRDHSDPKKREYYKYSPNIYYYRNGSNGHFSSILKNCPTNEPYIAPYCGKKYTLKEIKATDEKIKALESNSLDAVTRYKQIYIEWEGAGKIGPPPLKPFKITKEIGFSPIVIETLWSGEALLDTNTHDLGISYSTFDDCISEKQENITIFKKYYKAKLRQDIVFPKQLNRKYIYKCEAEVQEVHRQLVD